MDRLKNFWQWYRQTACILGVPLLLGLIVIGTQRTVATFTCETVGWKCESAFGASDAVGDFMAQLVDSNPNVDIVAKPRSKGR